MTTTTNKMTNKKALEFVMETYKDTLPKEVKEKLEKMVEQLDKKSGTDRKPTKVQQENETYKELILDMMTETKLMTVTEIQKAIPEFADFSNQKVASLVKQLKDAEKLDKVIEKGRSYFSKAKED